MKNGWIALAWLYLAACGTVLAGEIQGRGTGICVRQSGGIWINEPCSSDVVRRGPDATAAAATTVFSLLGNMLNRAMTEALSTPRVDAEFPAMRAQSERLLREEEERLRRDAGNRAKLEEARKRILGDLRSIEASTAPQNRRELQVIENRGIFGSTEIKPRDLDQRAIVGAQPPSEGRLPSYRLSAFQRAACGQQYLHAALSGFGSGQLEEAVILSREAEMIMSGNAMPTMQCISQAIPSSPHPIRVEEALKQTAIFGALLNKAAQQLAEYREAQKLAVTAKARKDKAEASLIRATSHMNDLRNNGIDQDAIANAMQIALAAEQEYAASVKTEAECNAALNSAKTGLNQTEQMVSLAGQGKFNDVAIRLGQALKIDR